MIQPASLKTIDTALTDEAPGKGHVRNARSAAPSAGTVGSAPVLVGARAIGRAVGVSSKTVTRWFQSGRTKLLFKSDGASRTSPIRCRRADLPKLRGEPAS